MRPSKSYCRDYGRGLWQTAGLVPSRLLVALVGGAVAGGLIGAVIGGKHAVRTGIMAGGVTGGVLGGAHANKKWDKVYWSEYNECRSW